MASELVVPYRDVQTGAALKLDLNNGYLYDQKGNQVGKWSPMESTTKERETAQLCADWVSDSVRGLRDAALKSPKAAMYELADAIRGSDGGRTIKMDLGTSDVHLPAALPNFAGGYRQELPVADAGSPPLLVNKPSDKYFIFDPKDAYQIASPIVGAPAAQVPEVAPRLNNQTFTTAEYALGGFVPTQIDAAADAPLRIRQATLKRILNSLMIRREYRVATLLTTSGNWNSSNVVTLGAGFQWDGGASSDPVKDIQTRIEQSLGHITGMIMAEPTWHAFQRNPAVQKYFTYKDGAAAIPDPARMQAILDLPPIYVARMKVFAPSGGATTYIWGTSVVLVRQPDQMPPTTQDDIATSYTFRWNATNVPDSVAGASGFASSGGFVIREFYNQVRGTMGGSQTVCVHHDAEAMTSGYVGGLILGAYQ